MEFKYLKKQTISRLPKEPGVYAFKKGREFLYIGKAANIRERIKNHFSQPAYRNSLFLNKVEKIGYIKTNSEIEALILEANLIKRYQPKYNVIWRDDKNYFYVGLTKEDFPRIFWTHQKKRAKIRKSKLEIEYVGPFVDGKALKQTLKILRKVFPYRSCRKIPNRPCLWYHLNRCLGPCLLKSKLIKEISITRNQTPGEKMKWVCWRNAKSLIKILKEGKSSVLKDLKREMKKFSKNQEFEEAARIRDQIEALEKVFSHTKIFGWGSVVITKPWQNYYTNWSEIEGELKKILKIDKKISRIEAYDVSNIQGQLATGSMITFIEGRPEKNFYRRFKIKIWGKPNDVAMLKEVLTRRLKHLEWGLPDLILIDGGMAQLSALLKVKIQNQKLKTIKVMALAKRKNELFIEGEKGPILLKDLSREVFNLILQLRDEAHRFALSYHKKLRAKDLTP